MRTESKQQTTEGEQRQWWEVTNVPKVKIESPLVGLEYVCGRGYLAYGDREHRKIAATPIDEPKLVGPMQYPIFYSEMHTHLECRAPCEANAFVLGDTLASYPSDKEFVTVAQYYVIPGVEWQRIIALEKTDYVVGGFQRR